MGALGAGAPGGARRTARTDGAVARSTLSSAQGIKSVPRRMRIQISRKRNDDEDAKDPFYSYVTAVDAPNGARGLQTKVIED